MKFLINLFLILALSSCVETVVVGSIATGAVVAGHSSAEETKNDAIIATKLTKALIENGLKNPGSYVEFEVSEGRILLMGLVEKRETARVAQDLAWQIEGVREVIDEIELKNKMKSKTSSFFRGVRDYLVTADARTRLLFARDVSSLNYELTTINGSLYLIGIADNDFEMRRVSSIAAKVGGVNRVVVHVIAKNDERRN